MLFELSVFDYEVRGLDNGSLLFLELFNHDGLDHQLLLLLLSDVQVVDRVLLF